MLAHRWLAFVGDAAYAMLMRVNVVVNAARRRMGLPYWSLSKMAKHKVKNAVEFISRFEEVVAHEAGSRGVDGRSEEHTSELQSLMRISYAVFCLKKKINKKLLPNARKHHH